MIFLTFILVGILGGTTGSLIKYAANQIPPLDIIIIRLGLSVLLLLPFVIKYKTKIQKKDRKLIILSSSFLFANILLFSIGVKHTSAIMSQLIYVPTSVIVALLAYILLKERLSSNQFIGLAITIFGILMLVLGSLQTSDIKSFGEPFGNLLIFIGLFSWAGYLVASRELVKELSPLAVSFVSTLVAFIFSIFVFFPYKTLGYSNNFSLRPDVAAALIISSITSVGFLYLSQNLIKKTSAFTASLVTYINPIAATIWGVLLFNEQPTTFLILSGIFVFVGVFIATSYNYLKTR